MPKDTVELDHLSVAVKRYGKAKKLYEAALGAIGMTVNMDVGEACGFGANGEKILWLSKSKKATGGAHIALRVHQRDLVSAFYDAALAAGAEDNGAPGPRPDYGPSYFAAFVHDFEGNNIEVVCYEKAASKKTSAAKKKSVAAPKKTSAAAKKRK